MKAVTFSRKEMARILRSARDLMNNNGDHWVKGRFIQHGITDKDTRYCSIGAINHVTGNPAISSNPASRALALVLVKSNPDIGYKTNRATLAKYLRDGNMEDAGILAEGMVMGWNDRHSTKWENVKQAFTEAARSLR